MVGVDVDLFIFDFFVECMILVNMYYMVVDYSVFEGMKVMGELVLVFCCGEFVVKDK